MKVEWIKELETGFVTLDNQHRELFYRINKLFDGCSAGSDCTGYNESVQKMLEYMEEYAIIHLNTEEHLMLKYSLPHVHKHFNEHSEFRENITYLKKILDSEGVTPNYIKQIKSMIADWLVQHIMSTDKELCGFLKAKNLTFIGE